MIIAVSSSSVVISRIDSCTFEKFKSMATTVSPSESSVEKVKHISPVFASL